MATLTQGEDVRHPCPPRDGVPGFRREYPDLRSLPDRERRPGKQGRYDLCFATPPKTRVTSCTNGFAATGVGVAPFRIV